MPARATSHDCGVSVCPARADGRHGGASTARGLPHYDHVFVLVEENESLASTYGPAGSAYLKNLAHVGVFADHYYGIGHQSLDNYIAMLDGQPDSLTTGSDCLLESLYPCAQSQSLLGGKNLADQMDVAGVSWGGYMDGTTMDCVHGAYNSDPLTFTTADPFQGNGNAANSMGAGPDYADRHNPFLFFPDIVGNTARCAAHVFPYTKLGQDIAAGTVPQFSFITPDTCHDGHDNPCSDGQTGGLVSMNKWLTANGPALVNYVNANNGLLLITDDEGALTDASGCCTGGPGGIMGIGGLVGLVAVGPGVKAGQTVSTKYDHMSLLRTVEDLFGISQHLNNARTAKAMTDLFATTSQQPGPGSSTGGSGDVLGGATGEILPTTATAQDVTLPWLIALIVLVAVVAGGWVEAGRRRRSRG